MAEAAKADGRYIAIANVDDLSADGILALFERQHAAEQRFRDAPTERRPQMTPEQTRLLQRLRLAWPVTHLITH